MMYTPPRLIFSAIFSLFVACTAISQIDSLTVITTAPDTTALSLSDMRFVSSPEAGFVWNNLRGGVGEIKMNGSDTAVSIIGGRAFLAVDVDTRGALYFVSDDRDLSLYHVAERNNGTYRVRNIPLWLSIIPPLIAIMLALIFKEVIVSLFVGIWSGAFIAGGLRIESLYYFVLSIFNTVADYIVNALNDVGHLAVIIFSLLIGGMVAIISKNGGMAGVVKGLSRYAKSARSSQFVTWLLGVAIFFDDYANTLIVGNTMRSVTDRFKVSREKLAYIVDSTAAPVAAVAFITTWIGAELGYIDGGLAAISDFPFDLTPYAIFVASLKYSFYPILTLCFILLLVYFRRDFGPMLRAEQRARSTGQVSSAATPEQDEPNMEDLGPVAGAPLRWFNAVIPVGLVIAVTIYGLLQTGMEGSFTKMLEAGITPSSSAWGDVWSSLPALSGDTDMGGFQRLGVVIGNANSYTALLWSSMTGVVAAIILTVSQRIIRLFDTMHHLTTGFKTMMPALIILTLAWALALTTDQLHTADYLTSLLSGSISPYLMPGIIFVLSAFIAFSTGSSWSTMAILYPIAIPT
ncbi:MAG: Na+/H+ antiporter NhaC family protein, partial [Saprospiraceae bacterium]|nr:Na+/H+ antiporter NhaC family protein [Saprospiraceae bacterium]